MLTLFVNETSDSICIFDPTAPILLNDASVRFLNV